MKIKSYHVDIANEFREWVEANSSAPRKRKLREFDRIADKHIRIAIVGNRKIKSEKVRVKKAKKTTKVG